MIVLFILVLAIVTPAVILLATVKLTEAEYAPQSQSITSSIFTTVRYWAAIGYTGFLFTGALGGILVATTSEYGGYSIPGCNFYDALLYGARCQGFNGAWVASAVLNFVLLIVQLSAASLSSPFFFPIALLLWTPPIYIIYLCVRRLRCRRE